MSDDTQGNQGAQRPPTPAEERKTVAEALKTEAEVELTRANLTKVQREIDHQEIDNKAANIRARAEEIALDEIERRHVDWANNDEWRHIYFFNDSITPDSVEACMAALDRWSRRDPGCDITIIINSPGGNVIAGMQLYDYIRMISRQGHHITTMALGMAASMGGILLQAGDTRVMGRETYILVHEVASVAWGKMGEIEDEVEFLHKIQDRILGIFADRTKLTKAQLAKNWKRKDWWFDSTEALRDGFVDEVR